MDKQTFEEIVTKYELEDSVKDIYVEGEDDRSFYTTHYKQGGKTFWDISSIDFSKEKPELEQSDYEAGNRDKIIYLLDCLKKDGCSNTRGIIDKDILPYTREIPKNEFIWATDYSCLEMYYFTETNIKKVNANTLKKMSLSVVEHVMKILQPITAVRIVEKKMRLSLHKPDIDKYIIVEKKEHISLDFEKYLACVFQKSDPRYKSKFGEFKTNVLKCLDEIKEGPLREGLRGHDLISALTYCVQKIEKNKGRDDQNEFQHMKESFLAAIYKNAVETVDMEKTELFQKIAAF